MLARVQTQVHELRLDLHGHWLRWQERAALRRLGRTIASRARDGEDESVRQLALGLAEAHRRLDTLAVECEASVDADRADLARVAMWMRPVVVARGICARAVIRHRGAVARRALDPQYEALGAAAAGAGPMPATETSRRPASGWSGSPASASADWRPMARAPTPTGCEGPRSRSRAWVGPSWDSFAPRSCPRCRRSAAWSWGGGSPTRTPTPTCGRCSARSGSAAAAPAWSAARRTRR